MDEFNNVNGVYGNVFMTQQSACSCVQVSRLPKDVLIEIEAIAFIP